MSAAGPCPGLEGRGLALGGFMAAGKSTVGRQLALRLGLPFIDLDEVIVERAGRSIPSIFAEDGEASFRALERDCLLAQLGSAPTVLALGGGTLHHADNALLVQQDRPVAVLELSWSATQARLEVQDTRPLASSARRLWLARRPGYQSAGTLIDVTGLGVEAAVAAVLEQMC